VLLLGNAGRPVQPHPIALPKRIAKRTHYFRPAIAGVGGHSYGAFMADTLLAHADLFKAGIAESGAPNRTLTPFGFLNERRTLWDAPKLYEEISPFM